MPDEYISREAAIEEIDKWLDTVGTALVGKGLSYYGELIGCIEDARAADVAEVVHGQWYMLEDCANAGLYCSACGRRVHHEEFAYKKLKSKYCPHCGARMDREGTAHDESERDFQTLCRRLGRGRGYQDRRQT